MRKVLSIFLLFLSLFLFNSTVWAAPISLDPIIRSSSGQPLGDCIGPDGGHFQATKAVCDTFNSAWGKSSSFALGQPSPVVDTRPLPVVIAQSLASGAPLVDCTGPDKKTFKATKEVCDRFNNDWKKGPTVLASNPTPTGDLSTVIRTSLAQGSPLGDCAGPDGKHFDATKEVCDSFNQKWGSTSAPFTAGKTTGIGLSTAIIRSSGGGNSGGSSSGGGSGVSTGSSNSGNAGSNSNSNSNSGGNRNNSSDNGNKGKNDDNKGNKNK